MGADELLRRLVTALEEEGVPYAIGGSVASMAYGEPRATLDIDVVASLGPDQVEAFCARFPAAEFYVDPEVAQEAVRAGGQFNIIHPSSGMKIDVFSDRNDDVAKNQVKRGRHMPALPGLTAVFSPAEELIVKKLEYYRVGGSDKHLRDVRAILDISGPEVDLDRISDWVDRLGLEDVWSMVSAADHDRRAE